MDIQGSSCLVALGDGSEVTSQVCNVFVLLLIGMLKVFKYFEGTNVMVFVEIMFKVMFGFSVKNKNLSLWLQKLNKRIKL